MYQGKSFPRFSLTILLTAGLLAVGGSGLAQTKSASVPDAQIEANVLKALAGTPELADQSITSTTVYGTVTLNGTVRDEPLRDLAEHVVANTAGVQKVVDQLTIGVPAPSGNDSQQDATNPNLQSDGTVAPPPSGQTQQNQNAPNTAGAPPYGANPQQGQYPPPYGAPPQGGQYPAQQYPAQQGGQYPDQQGGQYPGPQYPAQGQYPPQQAGQYPQPYGRQQYPPQYPYPPQQPYVPQKGGDAVVVPSGSVLRVRINQGMNSKNTAAGTPFDGVVLSNVFVGGAIAIPRGASFQGTVVDAHTAGQLKGKGELKLEVTNVTFGGKTYPVTTDFWWHQGVDKTGNTVGNTVGLAGVGALIGAVAGGGVGAAVGAGVGGVAGLGISSASGRGEATLPPEAIVTFHLTQPADVTTVSQAELNRLGAGLPRPQMQRRYPPPPPSYPYYGPGYYYPR